MRSLENLGVFVCHVLAQAHQRRVRVSGKIIKRGKGVSVKRIAVFLVLFAAFAGFVAAQASASNSVIYNNIPSPQPGNLPSVGFEATSTSEFGGQVTFAGSDRQNPVVTVLMSSWGCQSGHWYSGDCLTTPGATFSEPITLNLYTVGPLGAVGSLIGTRTLTFAIPYRPSASVVCGDGRWFDGTTCFNGFATPISFDLTSLSLTLPNSVIVGVAYNTTHYGYAPIGESAPCYTSSGGCGYDSLNVGVTAPPSVGTDPRPSDAYLNSSSGGSYCDGGVGGSGAFRLDAGCWTGYQPAIKVEASTIVGPPTSKNQCMNGGWQSFNNPAFKNQGDCISYVATHGKNPGNG